MTERAPNAVKNDRIKSSFVFPVVVSLVDNNGSPSLEVCNKIGFNYPINIIEKEFEPSINKCVIYI